MKKINTFGLFLLTLGLFLVLSPKAEGQNIQFLYDFGRNVYPTVQADRPYITTTVEQQSVDRFGDTFYFVDMAFLKQGAVSANWKFMRNLKFWKSPWAWHIRYDGGLRFVDRTEPHRQAISLSDSWMTGASYTYLSGDRRLMLSLVALYKYIRGIDQPHNYELTPIWKYTTPNGLITANGFISFWHEKVSRPGWGNTNFKLMSQPQFWLNLNKVKGVAKDFNLSVGTEIRISNNIDAPQWIVAPTIALKWSFK